MERQDVSDDLICPAIRLADRAIRKAMTTANSCEAEIKLTLGVLRYVKRELERQGDETKIAQYALVEPAYKVESLKDLTESAFSECAQSVLHALEALKGICGCPD
jgi:hypothetical protein